MGSTNDFLDKDGMSDTTAWLANLVGTWRGEETLSPSPWTAGGKADGRHRFRLEVGGRVLVQDYRQLQGDRETLTGHGVFTLDAESDAVLWYWFDSIGYPPLVPATGGLSGQTLTVLKTTPRGTQRAIFSLDGPLLHHQIEFRPPGDEAFGLVATAKLARQD